MSLRSRPLRSFVESIYQLLLILAARRASRARGLLRKNYVAALQTATELRRINLSIAPVTCRSPR